MRSQCAKRCWTVVNDAKRWWIVFTPYLFTYGLPLWCKKQGTFTEKQRDFITKKFLCFYIYSVSYPYRSRDCFFRNSLFYHCLLCIFTHYVQGFLYLSEDEKRLKKTFSPRAKIINFLYKFILRINTILRRNGDTRIAPLTHYWCLHILKRIFFLLIVD